MSPVTPTEKPKGEPNGLAHERSLYLRQHAFNPVQWMPWGDKAKQKALSENKLMLISIGYSACHWCHVMERESFENTAVARLMNDHFVCIKVDREERPDVDQVYMEAVQMMRQQGGWPLNCFTTPEGEPIYGGTYFQRAQWMSILEQLANLWATEPGQVRTYGRELTQGMMVSALLPENDVARKADAATLVKVLEAWKPRWDHVNGGPDKAPKFPLPANYLFLLRYAASADDVSTRQHVGLTLDRMCAGGLYDQIGGGFARYSTDAYWKVPHFEKMLYDNAQLLKLYAEAFAFFQEPLYRETALGVIQWLQSEMKQSEGVYAAAVDADSEGEEGKYYTYQHDELRSWGLWDTYQLYYHTGKEALWEDRLIPLRLRHTAEDQRHAEYWDGLHELNSKLLAKRSNRVPPATDTKVVTSWNAMLASGFLSAHRYVGFAGGIAEAESILNALDPPENRAIGLPLKHVLDSPSQTQSFCEDYAFVIAAWIDHYEASGRPTSLERAVELTHISFDRFYDLERGLFFQTAADQNDLLVRPTEISDNVIPAFNSVMAENLIRLGGYGNEVYTARAMRLLWGVEPEILAYPEGYGNWCSLYLKVLVGQPQVVITGPEAQEWATLLREEFSPFADWAIATVASGAEIFQNRFDPNRTLVFVCQHNACSLPFAELSAAAQHLKSLLFYGSNA